MTFPAIRITVLGSGTSVGVPTIGCTCAVCQSTDQRDKRLRPSILIQYSGYDVVVDTTPDFRTQVLAVGLQKLDAILFTHAHADHILGMDDVRPMNYRRPTPIPAYASPETLDVIRRVFQYAFDGRPNESSSPKVDLLPMSPEPFDLFGLTFTPVRLSHGSGTVWGFRFGRMAYLTDHNNIPEESVPLLQDLDVLFVDALRRRPHPTHNTLEQAIGWVERLKPRRAFFTHMCHDLAHEETEAALPPHIRLAYDGLVLEPATE